MIYWATDVNYPRFVQTADTYISLLQTYRCCKLLLSRATQTPSNISREIQLSVRKAEPRFRTCTFVTFSCNSREILCTSFIQNTIHWLSKICGFVQKSFTRISSATQSEEKASRVLGVVRCHHITKLGSEHVMSQVFSAFIVCWAPFFIMNLVQVACGQSCAPPAFLGKRFLALSLMTRDDHHITHW